MTYVQQTWTDNVTPVDAAHMSHIEAGIAAVEAEIPGAGSLVPAPVNGQWLKGVGGAAVWSPIAASDLPPQAVPLYGTNLPASPTDGQLAVLVDSVTNPSYQWHFRYNAGSTSPYKWEFVGGSEVALYIPTAEGTSSSAAVDLATVGPLFTLPRSGDYIVAASVTLNTSIGTPVWGTADVMKNGVAVPSGVNCVTSVPATNYWSNGTISPNRVNGCAAGDVIKLMYRGNASPVVFSDRGLSIKPARVS